jgi:hypothetical protein
LTKKVRIELFGPARYLSGLREVEVVIADEGSFGDVLVALAEKAPKLVGQVVDPAKPGLVGPNRLFLDGRRVVRDLSQKPADGTHLLLLLAAAGG